MANRAKNASLQDANSQQPRSFIYSPLITVNTTTAVATQAGILHGFLISTSGLTSNQIICYDTTVNSSNLPVNTSTIVGILNTSTTNPGFFNAGDVIFNTGLVAVTTTGTAGVIQIIYL